MKIVINTCYGGFGLSDKASHALAELKDVKLEVLMIFAGATIFKNMPAIERDDPDLVRVVEELGKEANGRYADLKVVEIPDDVKWDIEEYDGSEWIAEVHRTWS